MTGGPPRYAGPETPAVAALRRVARALGPLVERVVFIGGAVAPLLQTATVLASVRPTDDVDGVAASASYTEYHALQDALRQLGFKDQGMTGSGPRGHAHRWLVPGGGVFDLVPAGDHLGGTGSAWNAYALASAEALDLSSDAAGPLIVRHASSVPWRVSVTHAAARSWRVPLRDGLRKLVAVDHPDRTLSCCLLFWRDEVDRA